MLTGEGKEVVAALGSLTAADSLCARSCPCLERLAGQRCRMNGCRGCRATGPPWEEGADTGHCSSTACWT